MVLALITVGLSFVWPWLLLGTVSMAVIAWIARAPWRALASVAAVVLGLGSLVGGTFTLIMSRQEHEMKAQAQAQAAIARLHATLDAETVVDGIALPAGTEVTWTDGARTRLRRAVMPQPTSILGFSTRSVWRERDGWDITLESEQEIAGWPCGRSVKIDFDGTLQQCTLSRQVGWKGWVFPEGGGIRLLGPGRGIEVILQNAYDKDAVFVPEIGRPLPWSASMSASLNEDGSLDSVNLFLGEPLVVHGTPLQGIIRWRYDAATFGEGRARPPVAVQGEARVAPSGSGTGPKYERIVVRMSDGAVTREPGITSLH